MNSGRYGSIRYITSTRSSSFGQLDVDVHAAQHVALADDLQVVHHGVIALAGGLLRHVPHRCRDAYPPAIIARLCCAATCAAVCRRCLSSAAAVFMHVCGEVETSICACSISPLVRSPNSSLRSARKLRRPCYDNGLGFRIDHKVFFFDPELIILVRHHGILPLRAVSQSICTKTQITPTDKKHWSFQARMRPWYFQSRRVWKQRRFTVTHIDTAIGGVSVVMRENQFGSCRCLSAVAAQKNRR